MDDATDPLSRPPAWVQDAIFYQIFPDRFAKSASVPKPSNLEPWGAPPTVYGYKGGDLRGVIERLDYLGELGVTALYFNPVFQSAANHRYHTHDYTQVDPMLGGNAALRDLLDEAHDRGMRVVLDGVFNHASRGFFQFSDILENGPDSPYLDWFHIDRFPLNAYGGGDIGYRAWWDLAALPKFNTETVAVREFLWEIGTRWLEFGIDGWRLDVPSEIDDDDFWREFRRRCRAVNPECYIVGEIWDAADRWLQGDQFDAVMNYPFTRAIFGFVGHERNDDEVVRSGYGEIADADAVAFGEAFQDVFGRYAEAVTRAQLNLLGSHDTPRVKNVVLGDGDALRMAFDLLFAGPGAPCIYYGDEIGLDGGHDPGCREGMPWPDGIAAPETAAAETAAAETAPESGASESGGSDSAVGEAAAVASRPHVPNAWDDVVFDHVQALIALRTRHTALRRGAWAWLGGAGRVGAFARWLPAAAGADGAASDDPVGSTASGPDAARSGGAQGDRDAAFVIVANAASEASPLPPLEGDGASVPRGRYRDVRGDYELELGEEGLVGPAVPARSVQLLRQVVER